MKYNKALFNKYFNEIFQKVFVQKRRISFFFFFLNFYITNTKQEESARERALCQLTEYF